MGWLARLFGRKKHEIASSDHINGVSDLGNTLDKQMPDEQGSRLYSYDYNTLHEVIRLALVPALSELQQINERLDVTMAAPNAGAPVSANTDTVQRTIEYALAHFLGLLNKRGAGIKVNPAILGRTPDGNTALPFEPNLQHLLLVMNPLFPGLYSTQIILPSTFTKVDQLALLPNGVQTKSLHIDTRKAPAGFVEAIRSLQQNNANNLYLGVMEPGQDGSQHNLRYFPCTGSELRNPAPDRFPGDLMLYFDTQPKPIVVQRSIPNTDEVFASLHELEQGIPDWLKNETQSS